MTSSSLLSTYPLAHAKFSYLLFHCSHVLRESLKIGNLRYSIANEPSFEKFGEHARISQSFQRNLSALPVKWLREHEFDSCGCSGHSVTFALEIFSQESPPAHLVPIPALLGPWDFNYPSETHLDWVEQLHHYWNQFGENWNRFGEDDETELISPEKRSVLIEAWLEELKAKWLEFYHRGEENPGLDWLSTVDNFFGDDFLGYQLKCMVGANGS